MNFIKYLSVKPYTLLMAAVILLLTMSFVVEDRYIDLHIHDTMVVIALRQVLWLVSALFFLEWLVYTFFLNRRHVRFLTWIHVFSLLIFLALLLRFYVISNSQAVGDELTGDSYQIKSSRENAALLISVILFVFSQLVFVFNLIAAFLRSS